MSLLKESLQAIAPKAESSPSLERLTFEQLGLKELAQSVNFLGAKRGGREPGRHEWGRR